MKRPAPLRNRKPLQRKTPMKRTRQEAPAREKGERPMALLTPSRSLHRGTYAGTTSGVPVDKDVKARPGKRTPTAAERAWMDWIVGYGCIACRVDGAGIVAPQVHHMLRAGRRIGHLSTLPLCAGHHQHNTASGLVARHPYKARFEQRYGSEEFLLARLQAIYRGDAK